MPETVHVRTTFFIWLPLAVGCGLLTAVLWRRLRLRRLLDQQPLQPELCDGIETWVLILGYFFVPGLLHPLVSQLWLPVLSAPLFVLLVRSAARLHSPHPMAHLGFPNYGIRQDLLLGLIAGISGTAVANAVHAGVSWLYLEGFQATPEDHLLTQLARQGLTPVEWIVLAVSAIFAAPVIEELLFRGILQRWWALRPGGGDVAMGVALLMALFGRAGKILAARQLGPDLLTQLQPALFVLALAPLYLLVRRRATTPAPTAIFGTAALFAAVHSSVWPTPIPLFVLGLVLGVLAQRTQRLLAPLVVHMLFNAAACAVLLASR